MSDQGRQYQTAPPVAAVEAPPPGDGATPAQKPKEKKGFFGKLFGVFKDDKGDKNKKDTPPPPQTSAPR